MKVLILSSKFGMGHLSAARSLAEQIRQSGSGHKVLLADIFDAALPLNSDALARGYGMFVSHSQRLYNVAYQHSTHDRGTDTLSLAERYAVRRFAAQMRSLQPDVVIATYSFSARLTALYKRLYHSSLPLVTCITDVGAHQVWLNPETDLYLVAAPETRQCLLQSGVDAQRIAVTGVPVRSRFCPQPELRQENELLLMGGGLGMLPEDEQLYRALSAIEGLHITVLCGKNEALRRRLEGRFANLSAISFTAVPEQYMQRASLLLSKPGGVTTFEAIACELPLLTFMPALRQEQANCRLLLEHDMGMLLHDAPSTAAAQITALLRDRQRLQAMQQAMHRFHAKLQPQAFLDYLGELQSKTTAKETGCETWAC